MLEYMSQRSTHLAVVLALFVAVSVIEILASRKAGQWTLRDRLLNLGAGAVFLLAGGYLASIVLARVLELHLFKVSSLNPVVYMVLFALVQDLIYYFYHRLQHSWPLLWGIHKLHHTDTDVNITTSHRTHLLEQPIQLILIVVLPVVFLGVHPTGLLYATYFGLFFLYFGHSRLSLDLGPLSHVFVGPRFHRVHHRLQSGDLNCNFAQYFSFIDRIFGTFSKPLPIIEVETGVEGCTSLRQQWAPIIWPVPLLKLFGTR